MEQPFDDPVYCQRIVEQVILSIKVGIVVTEAIMPRINIDPPCLPNDLRQVQERLPMSSTVTYLIYSWIWTTPGPPYSWMSAKGQTNPISSGGNKRVPLYFALEMPPC